MSRPAIRDVVDGALLVEYPGLDDDEANRAAQALSWALVAHTPAGILDWVPAARTLLVLYEPAVVDRATLRGALIQPASAVAAPPPREVRVPVRYDGQDLDAVAQSCGLDRAELIRRHSGARYRVAFIGFAPGFPYLEGLPRELHTPRLKSPRTRVPSGSIAIADRYAGIYPASLPGGWNLLGRTSLRIFDGQPLLQPGDAITFVESGDVESPEERTEPPPPLARLRILSGDGLTSVQGGPQYGRARFGVPAGGAMDEVALAEGNALLGQNPLTPGLEVTLSGPEVSFLDSCRFCLTGAEIDAELEGRRISMSAVVEARPGERLCLGRASGGVRSYLCAEGLGEPLASIHRPVRAASDGPIRVVWGAQEAAFSLAGRQAFTATEYRVSPQSDRKGVRLVGPPIERVATADIPPEGTAPGAIQVPGDGLPIILGPDRPVTGGNTKIATVVGADLGRVAQLRPGAT
ncbi:MAG TPA: carboxyltransferase domain-containing protein, partial [Myxococcaceae bacterium]|nr:carboxyltransferase domain-containing protein [Myxococcaceae bacterium]